MQQSARQRPHDLEQTAGQRADRNHTPGDLAASKRCDVVLADQAAHEVADEHGSRVALLLISLAVITCAPNASRRPTQADRAASWPASRV